MTAPTRVAHLHMRLSTLGKLCRPRHIVRVSSSPPVPCRIDMIHIHGHPERWTFHEIRIGGKSELRERIRHLVSGERFRRGGILHEIGGLAPCQTTMDFECLIEYEGPVPEGEPFMADYEGALIM